MTDTIRAALDDAVRAYCHADGDCPCSHGCHCLIAPNADTRGGMADAIAAFLRALPTNYSVRARHENGGYVVHRETFPSLAAAVEEAAMETGHE
jgi:hypothetical protein